MTAQPRKRFGEVAITSAFTSAGSVVRAILQAGYLIVVARLLGASGYGSFTGIVALGTIGASLSGWGTSWVLLEESSRAAAQTAKFLSISLACTALTGLALAALASLFYVATAGATQAAAPRVVIVVSLAELVLTPVITTLTIALLARGHRVLMTLLNFIVPAARLAAALGVFLSLGQLTLPNLAATHFLATLAACALALALTLPSLGRPAPFTWPEALASMRRGTSYALSNTVAAGYLEIDKPLQVALLGPQQTGVYTAAFRIMNALSLPIWSVTTAALPKLFRDGKGAQGGFARALIRATAAYGVIAIGIAWAGAALIPALLGSDFLHSAQVFHWLAPWLPLFAIHQSCGTLLQTSGRRPLKMALETIGLLTIGFGNLVLDPRWGVAGAVATLVSTELFLAMTMLIAILRSPATAAPAAG